MACSKLLIFFFSPLFLIIFSSFMGGEAGIKLIEKPRMCSDEVNMNI